MSIFTVYFNPEQGNRSTLILREGLSLWAAAFGWIWAIYHRIWLLAGLGIAFSIIAVMLSPVSPVLSLILKVSNVLFFLFFANDLRALYLEELGYKLKDIILARSADEAELQYYQRQEVR